MTRISETVGEPAYKCLIIWAGRRPAQLIVPSYAVKFGYPKLWVNEHINVRSTWLAVGQPS